MRIIILSLENFRGDIIDCSKLSVRLITGLVWLGEAPINDFWSEIFIEANVLQLDISVCISTIFHVLDTVHDLSG